MTETTPTHRIGRVAPALALTLLTSLLIAACGGAASAPATDGAAGAPTADTGAATDAVASEAPAPTDDAGSAGSEGGDAALTGLVPADKIQAALGETPTPECDTSVLSGAADCVWTAADGSWLKVEDSVPMEMPDLASFTDRVTGALGLDEPVAGLGDAAYLGTSSRGTRIAVFFEGGRVVWVVLNKPGDATAQASLVTDIATTITAGL